MMVNEVPSSSALKVAALRALHQTMDIPPVFLDPIAERILGPDAAGLLESYRPTTDNSARLRGTLAIRSVIAEETIADAMSRGIRQCVVLGAGLDTFAYRNTHPRLDIFEVDHPTTQRWKRDLLRRSEIGEPVSVRYVAADLDRDDLHALLSAAGFDRTRAAVFAMLGVTPYVARDSLLGMFGRIAADGGEGTEIVFDYTEPFHRAPAPVRAYYEAAAARLAAVGEPWVTFFEPDALALALKDAGFSRVRDLDAATLHKRFILGRADGLTISALVHLVQARI